MGIEPTLQLVTGTLVLKTRRPTRRLGTSNGNNVLDQRGFVNQQLTICISVAKRNAVIHGMGAVALGRCVEGFVNPGKVFRFYTPEKAAARSEDEAPVLSGRPED
jgi:hypothetical protein